jgi:hypothetical protein
MNCSRLCATSRPVFVGRQKGKVDGGGGVLANGRTKGGRLTFWQIEEALSRRPGANWSLSAVQEVREIRACGFCVGTGAGVDVQPSSRRVRRRRTGWVRGRAGVSW